LAVNVEPKPTAAFALSVIAGLVTILVAFLLPSSPLMLLTGPTVVSMIQMLGIVAGVLIIVGSWLLYNNAAQRKLGSILVLVFSLISMNILGLILGLIGGFLGYTHKTTASSASSSGRSFNPP
jgi:uncharacterized membrane protein